VGINFLISISISFQFLPTGRQNLWEGLATGFEFLPNFFFFLSKLSLIHYGELVIQATQIWRGTQQKKNFLWNWHIFYLIHCSELWIQIVCVNVIFYQYFLNFRAFASFHRFSHCFNSNTFGHRISFDRSFDSLLT